MSRSRRSVACVAAVVAALPLAAVARADFGMSVTGGPLAVTSGVLNPPGNIVGNVGTCVPKTSIDVILTWDQTTPVAADGYEIYQATSRSGPYTLLATVPGSVTSYDDTSTTFGTPYFYELESTRDSWTSPLSAWVKVKTLSRRCA